MVLTAGGRVLALNDPRRFGSLDLVPTAEVAGWGPFVNMGPEPLDPGFDGSVLAATFAGRRTPVKAALLDQRRVAGLGNIYVCEALHRTGIAPARAAGRIGRERLDRLAAAIQQVLRESIEAGRLHACETLPGRTGNWAISPNPSPCTGVGRGAVRVRQPGASDGWRRGGPPSGAPPASADA